MTARGLLEILADKEWSLLRIGNVAKLDCMFFTPNTVSSIQVNNTGATSVTGYRRRAVTEVANHVRMSGKS
jgi:hypothetical protein